MCLITMLLSRNLTESVRNFYYHCVPFEMRDMDSNIIAGLPKSMRTQVGAVLGRPLHVSWVHVQKEYDDVEEALEG